MPHQEPCWRLGQTVDLALLRFSSYEEIHVRLVHFINFIYTHPRIQKASANDKLQLKCELQIFLNAHIDQCEDNVCLQSQETVDVFRTPRSSYLKWAWSAASDHLSSKYTFAFIACLLGHSANLERGGPEEDYLPGSLIKFIAQDCRCGPHIYPLLYPI